MNGIYYLTHYLFAYSNIPSIIQAVAERMLDVKFEFFNNLIRGTQHRNVWQGRPFVLRRGGGLPGLDSRRGKGKTR